MRRLSPLEAVLSALAISSGLSASAFGTNLLMPWHTFTVSGVYDAMAVRAPEWVWGAGFLGCGLLQLVSGLLPWYTRRQLPLLTLWRFVLTGLWVYLVVMLALGDYRSTGVSQYALEAATAALTLLGMRRRWLD